MPVSVFLVEVLHCFVVRFIDVGYLLTQRFLEYHSDGRFAKYCFIIRDQLPKKPDIRSDLRSAIHKEIVNIEHVDLIIAHA